MKDCVVRIGIKRSLSPAQSVSVIMSSPGDSTEAHSPPPPPAGQDIDDDDDFLPADFSSQHNYAQPPTDESRAENNTSTNEVPVPAGTVCSHWCFLNVSASVSDPDQGAKKNLKVSINTI